MIKRIFSLIENIATLGPLMGYGRCALYLIQTRGKPDAAANANFKNIPFTFRRRDISAVKEVLIKEEYGFLRSKLLEKQNPVVFDIGAHIGLFAIWVFSINPNAEIYSVEASPGTFKRLSENLNATKAKGFSWKIFHNAAWGSLTEISFMDESESSMSHRVNSSGNVTVPTITLDELMHISGSKDSIDVVKIDIEGAEESFLCSQPFDMKKFKTIAMEIHPALCDTKKIEDLLSKDFILSNIKQNNLQSKPLLFCTGRN